jgi:restriction endonuclease Mrr
MAKPKPYIIAKWVAEEITEATYVDLRSTIDSTLRSHMTEYSKEQIEELTEILERDVFSELGVVANQSIESGVEPTFVLEGVPGSAYIKAHNIEALSILTRIRSISPSEFEQICADILKALGATSRRVGRSGDGGVDFIATDLPVSPECRIALRACHPIVIGQAKRYKEDDLVTVTDMRSFLGGALLKADELKRTDDRFGLYSPVSFAFWTTSDFNKPAREFAKLAGLWRLGGLALAQLILHLKLTIP